MKRSRGQKLVLGKMRNMFSNALLLTRLAAWNTKGPGTVTSKLCASFPSQSQKSERFTAWQCRMGHRNRTTTEQMISSEIYGMNMKETSKNETCKICVRVKHVRELSTGKLAENSKEITIHMVVCGPFQTQTFGGKRYLLAMSTAPHKFT